MVSFYDVPAPTALFQLFVPTLTDIDFGMIVNSVEFGKTSDNLIVGGGDNGATKMILYDAANSYAVLHTFTTVDVIQRVTFT